MTEPDILRPHIEMRAPAPALSEAGASPRGVTAHLALHRKLVAAALRANPIVLVARDSKIVMQHGSILASTKLDKLTE